MSGRTLSSQTPSDRKRRREVRRMGQLECESEIRKLTQRIGDLEAALTAARNRCDDLVSKNFMLQTERDCLFEQKEDQRKLIHGIANRMNAA